MTSEREFRDLSALAVQRVEMAVNSVGQLLEPERQVHLLTEAAASLIAAAAEIMRGNMRDRDNRNERPSLRECHVHLLATIAKGLGITAESFPVQRRETKP